MVLSPEKDPIINDRKWVHINIDRFIIVNYRSFSTVKIHAFEVEVVYTHRDSKYEEILSLNILKKFD